VSHADPAVRKRAVDILGNVGSIDARSMPALIEAVADPQPKVRDAAVLRLSKMGPYAAAAAETLKKAAADTDPTVRKHAAALERVTSSR